MPNYEHTPTIWKQWEKGLNHHRAMGYHKNFPLYERFKQGEQWPPATPRTKSLPRPVFNIVEMNIRHKRASILSQPMAFTFTPADTLENRRDPARASTGADTYTDLAAQLWAHTQQDYLNTCVVDDAATLGTGIWHYYWDAQADGPDAQPRKGDIRGETIDPLALVLENPTEVPLQTQKYIIIGQRTNVREVSALAEREGLSQTLIEKITADISGPEATYQKESAEDTDAKCTLLTRYSRDESGQVVFSVGVRTTMIIENRPLTPANSKGRPIRRYPIEIFTWRRCKGAAYGIGETQDLMANQKAINFNMAMMLLSVQQTAWPKLLTKPGALRQPVTNEPGEHIVDYQHNGDGIKFMQPPSFTNMPITLVNTMVDLTRRITGMSEVVTGENLGAGMAASAILALQSQAKTPVVEIQKRLWHSMEQIGYIWLEFFGAYYGGVLPAGDVLSHLAPYAYSHLSYNLSVKVGAASEYSRALAQTTLDKMLERGDIDIDMYIELSDSNIAPFKEEFRRLRAEHSHPAQSTPTEVQHDLPLL
ncbi:hypothetical protein LJB77_01465 [Ruminococcaceae bacterium OttesenSCG-928-N02]|nr:hypothetical protein [Ruminococcaceae bacterium OttesenSCG-928-N02]